MQSFKSANCPPQEVKQTTLDAAEKEAKAKAKKLKEDMLAQAPKAGKNAKKLKEDMLAQAPKAGKNAKKLKENMLAQAPKAGEHFVERKAKRVK
jgi:hypothetical protein